MAMEYKSGFCKKCAQHRKVERPKTNHILHLLMSVITAGLWLIVWFGVSIKFGGWRCETCGSKNVNKVS